MTPLLMAIESNNIDVVTLLLAHKGINVNLKSEILKTICFFHIISINLFS